MDNEEKYRYLVSMATISQNHFVSLLVGGRGDHTKYRTWLCLMGLMETWDMKNG